MPSCLESFIKDIVQQIGDAHEMLDQRHYRLLLSLPSNEKQALAKAIIDFGWNIGSPKVMKYLQKTNILSMSDLIVNKYNQNQCDAQLIFNDLLETEHMLLADVLKNANSTDPIGLTICDLLNEGFKRLCNDAIQNPNILVHNYLEEVDEYIQDECFEDVRLMHLKLLLEEGPNDTADAAISAQSNWNQEITDKHSVFKSFLSSIVGNDFKIKRLTLETILSKCNDWQQQNWKTVLLLLRMVIDTGQLNEFKSQELNDFKKMTKTFLKDTFRSSVDEEDENGFYVLFLIGRQITRYNETLLGNYGTWFKDTIGEMKYKLKTNQFTLAMQFLAGMVQMENDTDILDVHINTYIPAAPRCNELVLNYKELCRSRQMHLKNPNADKTAVIDEDVDFFLDDD
ncbi:uncharacterized protein LOC116346008 [Contarinia nasturtii]|uniref:uncharacterized protein LOC116346008 n=1 Tax=Contarinia nasturtii TaxID=265458 RepID=UPI0012D4382D|nr:uncharacterized protein LOC116346008 [Contarinia nasturtii]